MAGHSLRIPGWLIAKTSLLVFGLILISSEGIGQDLHSQVQLLMQSPDVTVSGSYSLATRFEILEKLLGAPILLSRLWDAYQFSPSYRISLQGTNIHVEDPTGIIGDLSLVEQSGNRRVYLGAGALNHSLVPAFRGKMALVLTTEPKGTSLNARIDVYVRADSRMLGFMAWTMGPLVKPRVENRMNMNVVDVGTIVKDLTTQPQKAVALLKKEDAAALVKLLPPAANR
jgi:hypothetical protein